jgi:ubiquinone/menaquinone biosynthesis C-methylase UbiE
MDHNTVRKYWDKNAEAWIELSRMGYDIYRDYVNTPAFLKLLPDVKGLRGLDVGCGEGHNTRLVAKRGASMTAFDISLNFVRAAHKMGVAENYAVEHCLANAVQIPIADNVFDFVIATMSIMDMPEQERVLAEVYRVLRPGGFFQFSICHPCFMTRHRKPLRDENGDEYAVEIGGYFNPFRGEIENWFFSNAPQELKDKFAPLQTPRFDNTLSGWLNILLDVGFRMERFVEPSADEETIKRCPHVADTRVVGYFLIILCRKAE